MVHICIEMRPWILIPWGMSNVYLGSRGVEYILFIPWPISTNCWDFLGGLVLKSLLLLFLLEVGGESTGIGTCSSSWSLSFAPNFHSSNANLSICRLSFEMLLMIIRLSISRVSPLGVIFYVRPWFYHTSSQVNCCYEHALPRSHQPFSQPSPAPLLPILFIFFFVVLSVESISFFSSQ